MQLEEFPYFHSTIMLKTNLFSSDPPVISGFLPKVHSYGFNGMERENEHTSGNYDFGSRMFSSSLARSFSVDPKINIIPYQGSYSFFSNNPIYFIDKDGEIIEVGTEATKSSYNSAVLSVFTGNDAAINALSIGADGMSVKPISQEDYTNIMQSLNTVDQQAAFRGLYLASQSEATYFVQVIEGDQKAFMDGEAVSTADLKKTDGVNYVQNKTNADVSDALFFDIAISKDEAGEKKDIYLTYDILRSESAMVLGTIITAYLHSDPKINNENFYRPMENNKTVTAVQNENIMMRASGMGEMSGNNFLKPDGSSLTDDEKSKCASIPEQLRFMLVHYTKGIEEVKTLPAEQ